MTFSQLENCSVISLLLITFISGGCIPIPSTQNYIANGKLKPQTLCGSGSQFPIQFGTTRIDDAVKVLADHISGPVPYRPWAGQLPPLTNDDVRNSVMQLSDAQQYGCPYEVVTGHTVWPFLGIDETETRTEFIILKTDSEGVVVQTYERSEISKLIPKKQINTPFAATRPSWQTQLLSR